MTVRASAAVALPPFIRGPARTEDLLYEMLAAQKFGTVHHGAYLAHVSQRGHGNFSFSQIREHVGERLRLVLGLEKPGDIRACLEKTRQGIARAHGDIASIREYAASAASNGLPPEVLASLESELAEIESQLEETHRGLRPNHEAYAVIGPMIEQHRKDTEAWQRFWRFRLRRK